MAGLLSSLSWFAHGLLARPGELVACLLHCNLGGQVSGVRLSDVSGRLTADLARLSAGEECRIPPTLLTPGAWLLTPDTMLIARTRQQLDEAVTQLRGAAGSLALVPTMGALHDGHLTLLNVARGAARTVAASIFVNPAQFAPHEDFSRYPRDEAGDLEKLARAGCDLAWLPDVDTMYPPGGATMIDVEGPAVGWEGAIRPAHFRGVATVVAKLFGQMRPDAAVFGEKDWQQLQVIRRMVADLALPVRIVGAPVVREADGVAMSSRNRFLTPAERRAAPCLYARLCEARAAMAEGVAAAHALPQARQRLAADGLVIDYFALVDGPSLREIDAPAADARLIAAARLGSVRLLDNIAARRGSEARKEAVLF